jgi:hypothetical protein
VYNINISQNFLERLGYKRKFFHCLTFMYHLIFAYYFYSMYYFDNSKQHSSRNGVTGNQKTDPLLKTKKSAALDLRFSKSVSGPAASASLGTCQENESWALPRLDESHTVGWAQKSVF